MGVAQIPRVQPAAEHPAVVGLGVDHHLCVLLREELRVERVGAVAREVIEFVGAQLQKLPHRTGVRGRPRAKRHRIAIGLRLAHMVQRRVALARHGGFAWVHVLQIPDHRVGRPVEAVEVETINSHALPLRPGRIDFAQRGNEVAHLAIAPHPRGEALEVIERGRGVVGPLALHETVDAPRVGPVAFDGDRVETVFGDEAQRDFRSHAVELGGAVGRLAEQDQIAAGRHFHKCIVVRTISVQTPAKRANGKEWGFRWLHDEFSPCGLRKRLGEETRI